MCPDPAGSAWNGLLLARYESCGSGGKDKGTSKDDVTSVPAGEVRAHATALLFANENKTERGEGGSARRWQTLAVLDGRVVIFGQRRQAG